MANIFEHCGYGRAEFVCARDWAALRAMGADGTEMVFSMGTLPISILFRVPEKIRNKKPDVRAIEEYGEPYNAIMEVIEK